MQYLLEAGASNVNAPGGYHGNALLLASDNWVDEIVELLTIASGIPDTLPQISSLWTITLSMPVALPRPSFYSPLPASD